MDEQLLPPSVLSKASLRGNEYAWPLAADEEVVAAAACGLANLGGQAQFRVPEETCELYWLSADSSERRSGEPWESYVARSAEEVAIRSTRAMNRPEGTAGRSQPGLNLMYVTHPSDGVSALIVSGVWRKIEHRPATVPCGAMWH